MEVLIPAGAETEMLMDWHRGTSYAAFGPDCKTFAQTLAIDFQRMELHLPERVTRVLDIGCGLAGIDVLLKRKYPAAELWLLDGDGYEPRRGYNRVLNAYSSRTMADQLLALNGIKADRWIDVNTVDRLQADLVVSLASWGYHYPLSTYDVSGFCIADLRKGVEAVRGKVIQQGLKFNRCAWRQGVL